MGDREDGAPVTSSDLEKSDNSALVPQEDDLGDALQKKFYDPLDHISPKQQKFALMQVTTNLSTSQIASTLGVSSYKRREWEKDDHVQAYLNQLKKQYNDSEMVATARRQRRYIREQMFMMLVDRMQDPEAAVEVEFQGKDVSIQEIINYKERFIDSMSAKDFMQIWDKIEKQTRLDGGEATERVDDAAIEHQARKRFTRYKARATKSKKLKERAKQAVREGETFEEFQARMQREQAEEAEFEEVSDQPELVDDDEGEQWDEEFEIEEWEITKRG